ncbi:MAG: alpha/beta fold hydrolase [Rhodobacteraceae bacterium]|nr:alpha/beta fold hydrolase [Paracoccaceae bacterium]
MSLIRPLVATAATAMSLNAAAPAEAKECVVLLHGLARSSHSFLVMEWRLRRKGYDVVNVGYPSKEATIETLASATIPDAISQCVNADKIHFVTHSMGGILMRYFMENTPKPPGNLGHVVMLGPPNSGSPVVDQLAELPGFELWNGIAGMQLGTGRDSLPNKMGPVKFSLGVVAGNQSISPILSNLIDGPDDGKVAVESTKVGGMSDFIVLPVTHTFMMNNPAVFDQVVHYLRSGRFSHN